MAVDTSGAALDALLAEPAGIDLLTPNAEELSAAVGRPLATLGEVVAAAREIVERGVDTVLASLGADGLVAVTADRAVFARAAAPYVANTAGAGDAALAGFLLGLTREAAATAAGADPLAVAAASAAEWGAHAVAHATTLVSGTPHGIRALVDTAPDLERERTPEGDA